MAGNLNSDGTQAASVATGASAAGGGPPPSNGAQERKSGGAASAAGVPAPAAGGKGQATGDSGSSTQEGGVGEEKRALESAWSLYLQVTNHSRRGLCLSHALSHGLGPGKITGCFLVRCLKLRF